MNRLITCLVISLCVLIIPTSASAVSCFTSEEILLINNIAIKNNESSSLLLGIFDMICERVSEDVFEEEFQTFRDSIGNMTEEKLLNYTDYITNKTQLIDALSAIADIINTTSKIDEYQEEIDTMFVTKMDEFRSFINERMADTDEEFEWGYVKKADLDEYETNMTLNTQMKINSLYNNLTALQYELTDLKYKMNARPDYTILIFIIVAIIIVGIAWKLGYIKPKTEKYPKKDRYTYGKMAHDDHIFNPEIKELRKKLNKDPEIIELKKKYEDKIAEETKKIRKGIKTIRNSDDQE